MISAGTSGASDETRVFNEDLGAQTELAVVIPTVSFDGTAGRPNLGAGVRCVMHDPVKCAATMATASGKDVSGLLGNGVCNPSANVRECGWDCGRASPSPTSQLRVRRPIVPAMQSVLFPAVIPISPTFRRKKNEHARSRAPEYIRDRLPHQSNK